MATKSSNTPVSFTQAMYDSRLPAGASMVTVAVALLPAGSAGTTHAFTPRVSP